MTNPNVELPNTFGIAMATQLLVLLIALAAIYFTGVEISLWGELGFAAVALGIAGALVTYAAALLLTRSQTHFGATLRRLSGFLHPLFARYSWPQILLVSIAAGVCEELLFRGFLQPWLSRYSAPLVGLVVASAAFALLHFATLTYFLLALLLGLILGVTYWVSESLLSVIVWHAVYDICAIAALARNPRLLGIAIAGKPDLSR